MKDMSEDCAMGMEWEGDMMKNNDEMDWEWEYEVNYSNEGNWYV